MGKAGSMERAVKAVVPLGTRIAGDGVSTAKGRGRVGSWIYGCMGIYDSWRSEDRSGLKINSQTPAAHRWCLKILERVMETGERRGASELRGLGRQVDLIDGGWVAGTMRCHHPDV